MTRPGASARDIEDLYRRRFRAFARSVTAVTGDREAALDVVQDGFAVALARRRSFRGDGSLEGWLWRIVLNVARDRRRTPPREETSGAVEVGGVDDYRHDDEQLRAALLALPERQRLAIFLRYDAELSYPQIADVLGVAPGTVAATLNAAHGALRRNLEEVRK